MRIKRFTGGSLMSNGYIISSRDKGICYIIDPGYEPKKFTGYVKEQELIPAAVLLTHHHHDHVGGAAKVADILDIPVMMSFEDSLMYKGKVDSYLQDGQMLDLDGQPLMIRLTPGHTKGSLCIEAPQSRVVFTGDTIFYTDLGRTDLVGGSPEDMVRSCAEVIDRWPDAYTIYPGHDEKAAMSTVRKVNAEFLQCLEEYSKWK